MEREDDFSDYTSEMYSTDEEDDYYVDEEFDNRGVITIHSASESGSSGDEDDAIIDDMSYAGADQDLLHDELDAGNEEVDQEDDDDDADDAGAESLPDEDIDMEAIDIIPAEVNSIREELGLPPISNVEVNMQEVVLADDSHQGQDEDSEAAENEDEPDEDEDSLGGDEDVGIAVLEQLLGPVQSASPAPGADDSAPRRLQAGPVASVIVSGAGPNMRASDWQHIHQLMRMHMSHHHRSASSGPAPDSDALPDSNPILVGQFGQLRSGNRRQGGMRFSALPGRNSNSATSSSSSWDSVIKGAPVSCDSFHMGPFPAFVLRMLDVQRKAYRSRSSSYVHARWLQFGHVRSFHTV